MKHNILAMALGLSIVAAPAMADTFNLGDLSGVSYGNTEDFLPHTSGSVASTYNFTLSQASIVHLSLTDGLRLTGLNASLYNGTTLETVIGPLNYNGTTKVGDWQSTTALAAGTYSINVVGAYATNHAASYALTLSSQVAAPVPGPAGFIVAGAGALVVAARKRRKTRLAVA